MKPAPFCLETVGAVAVVIDICTGASLKGYSQAPHPERKLLVVQLSERCVRLGSRMSLGHCCRASTSISIASVTSSLRTSLDVVFVAALALESLGRHHHDRIGSRPGWGRTLNRLTVLREHACWMQLESLKLRKRFSICAWDPAVSSLRDNVM